MSFLICILFDRKLKINIFYCKKIAQFINVIIQYRKRREVYDVNLEIISGMLERCDVFTEGTKKFFESHKKEFKKGAQRMKNKKGKFYLFFVENK